MNQMRQLNKLQTILFCAGDFLMVIGAAIRIFDHTWSLWIFSIGALLFSLMVVKAEYLGHELTLVRLRRQQLFGCVCFILCALCMSMQTYHYGIATSNEWILPLTIGCVLQLYTAWRIPQELEKSKQSPVETRQQK